MTEATAADSKKGSGSFSIPSIVIDTLLNSKASAYEICAYLTLARFTEESGRYSTASISAINRYTGANKTKGGPVDRALERLKTIRAKRVEKTLTKVSNGRKGSAHALIDKWVEQEIDLGPIVFDRDTWVAETGEILPDGPTERSAVLHVLPDFGADPADRIWFGNNLVSGVGEFSQPLKALKNAGDVAARLLIAMYQANDMETWGGVRPIGTGRSMWSHYEPVSEPTNFSTCRLLRSKRSGSLGPNELIAKCCENSDKEGKAIWMALDALDSAGLVYEVVLALNRDAKVAQFSSGEKYSNIPDDAEPLYELDARSKHGYKPQGEEGVGWAMARTAGDFQHPVATQGGKFDLTYAALVPPGHGVMIAGIYRLRFRVSNPKNAGVKGAWAGIKSRNQEAMEFVNKVRRMSQHPELDGVDKSLQETPKPAPEAAPAPAKQSLVIDDSHF